MRSVARRCEWTAPAGERDVGRPANLVVVVVGLLDLLDYLPDVFGVEGLRELDPADRAVLAQVGKGCLAAVAAAAATAEGGWPPTSRGRGRARGCRSGGPSRGWLGPRTTCARGRRGRMGALP